MLYSFGMKTMDPSAVLRELRALVATYLEGSDDAPRAHALLDALDTKPAPAAPAAPIAPATFMPDDQARGMFGCTEQSLDKALAGKEPRDIAMYAMGTLSNAQELIKRSEYEGQVEWSVTTPFAANTIRQLMNVAKYAIDKAVPR